MASTIADEDVALAVQLQMQYEEEARRAEEERKNDELLAKLLAEEQSQEQRAVDRSEPLRMSEKEDVKKLMKNCGLSQDVALEIYEAHGRSYTQTCYSLGVTPRSDRYSLSPSTSRSPPAPRLRQVDTGVEIRRVPIHNANEEAAKLHVERNALLAKLKGIRSWQQKQPLQSQVDSLEEQINGLIERSHRDMVDLDLHQMTVDGAVAFVKKAYAHAMDGTQMTIITGVGNNSVNNVAQIKPAVHKWLKENGIKFQKIGEGQVGLTVRK